MLVFLIQYPSGKEEVRRFFSVTTLLVFLMRFGKSIEFLGNGLYRCNGVTAYQR